VKKRLALWGPVALWAGVLFFASSRSDTGPIGRIPDWVTHGLVYLVLGVLLLRALSGGVGVPSSAPTALLAVLLATLYGVSDEWHQSFVPGRDSSAGDVAKDAVGASLGVWLLHRRNARRPFLLNEDATAGKARGRPSA
jgi:VanZ family protein